MRFSERQELIESSLARDGHVSVPVLAKACGVAPETARRDLAKLEKMGLVRRVHGGAIPPTHEGFGPENYTANLVQVAAPSYREETAYSDKTQQHMPEKTAIARAAMELIPRDRALLLSTRARPLRLSQLHCDSPLSTRDPQW